MTYKAVQGVNDWLDTKQQAKLDLEYYERLGRENHESYVITKNDPGCPQSREVQDKQFKDAVKELEKKLGKKLNPSEVRELHDHVSGQDYGYHELVEEGYWLLGGS